MDLRHRSPLPSNQECGSAPLRLSCLCRYQERQFISLSLIGTQGDNYLAGGPADETLVGGEGDDVLEGGLGDDTLIGAAGDDVLEGGMDIDSIIAGPGDDVIIIRPGHVPAGRTEDMSGGSGTDVVLLLGFPAGTPRSFPLTDPVTKGTYTNTAGDCESIIITAP